MGHISAHLWKHITVEGLIYQHPPVVCQERTATASAIKTSCAGKHGDDTRESSHYFRSQAPCPRGHGPFLESALAQFSDADARLGDVSLDHLSHRTLTASERGHGSSAVRRLDRVFVAHRAEE